MSAVSSELKGIKVCLVPGCGMVAKSRNLCKKHYQEAAYLVRAKRTTWARMERLGRCGGSRRSRRTLTASQRWFLSAKVTP